jgi:hypothetical protein
MDLVATGGDEGVEFVLLEEGLGDEIGEVDVGEEVVVLLDVLLAVDADLALLRLLLYRVVLLQHQLLVLTHQHILLTSLQVDPLTLPTLLVLLLALPLLLLAEQGLSLLAD